MSLTALTSLSKLKLIYSSLLNCSFVAHKFAMSALCYNMSLIVRNDISLTRTEDQNNKMILNFLNGVRIANLVRNISTNLAINKVKIPSSAGL